MCIFAPTCVQVSASLQPPVWHHTAVGTSGSPPSCGRWRRRGTERWTYTPLDTHMAPSTRMRTAWHCCSTSCAHTVTGRQWRAFAWTHTRTRTNRHKEKETEALSACVDAHSLLFKTKRQMCRGSHASCSVFCLVPFPHTFSRHFSNRVTVCRQKQTKAL